jgi:AmmeMemoRadiSam system protein B
VAAGTPLAKQCGFVVPHAGYVYSGPVAAHAYAALATLGKPDVAVLIGPNHHTPLPPLALSPATAWETPLGQLQADMALTEKLASLVPDAVFSEPSHRYEHSIEVQLPFLQHLYGSSLRIMPVAMGDQSYETALALGKALVSLLKGEQAVLLASSDFSHYLPASAAAELDKHVLDGIVAMDAEEVGREVESRGLTVCGYGPVMATLICLKGLGARQAKLLKYANSGDVSGDRRQVVAYAALQVGPD